MNDGSPQRVSCYFLFWHVLFLALSSSERLFSTKYFMYYFALLFIPDFNKHILFILSLIYIPVVTSICSLFPLSIIMLFFYVRYLGLSSPASILNSHH